MQWDASGGPEPLHFFGGDLQAFPATALAGGDLLLLGTISTFASIHGVVGVCLLFGKERLGTARTRAGIERGQGQSQHRSKREKEQQRGHFDLAGARRKKG